MMVSNEEDFTLLKDFAVGNTQFTAEVYKELLKSNSGNFVVCPLSVEIILALVHAGAGGRTAQQLAAGLHLPESTEEVQRIFKALTPLLQGNEFYSLSSANKIYISKACSIINEFQNIAVKVFEAEIQNIDFANNQQAACEINRWVEKTTHDKIKDIVSPDDLNADTRAVLINAMYFHGKWAQPFKTKNTKKRRFFLDSRNKVKVDMMEQTGVLKFYESMELNAKFLEMPYAGSSDFMSLTIVLPNEKNGLADLEARIEEVFAAPPCCPHKVHVVTPKFKMESTIQFIPILKALGIKDAFESSADFSRMIDQNAVIDDVIQKAFIDVEEEGTTASAATVARLCAYSLIPPPPPKEFIADHPFVFYIKIKDVIFFMGRYCLAKN